MLGQIVLGTLAAFGAFCVLWAVFGLFLPNCKGGALVYLCSPGKSCDGIVLYCRWLRGLGLLKAPLLLVDSTAPPIERQRLFQRHPHLEFCSLEELPSRLELERNKVG